MSSKISLHNILNANKMTRPDFLDWYRNVRIILKYEKTLYVLENPIPNVPIEDVIEEVRNKHQRYVDNKEHVACVMLVSISLKLQKQQENMHDYTITVHLKELFDEASGTKRYGTSKELFRCKITKDSLVKAHVLKMIGYIKKIGQLDFVMDHELSVDLVL